MGGQRAREVVEVLYQFGLTDEEITEHDRIDADDPIDYVEAWVDLATGGEDDASIEGRELLFLYKTLRESPRGIFIDWNFAVKTALWKLNNAIEVCGFEVAVSSIDGIETQPWHTNNHPEAFHIDFTDADGTTESVIFRFPPRKAGCFNFMALVTVLNQEFLEPRGHQILGFFDGGDHYACIRLETDRVERLTDKYGDRIAPFDDPLLHERPEIEQALDRYDPRYELDHEAAYDVPEPADVIKLENRPEVADYVAAEQERTESHQFFGHKPEWEHAAVSNGSAEDV